MRQSLLFTSLMMLLLSSCQKSIVWDDLILTPTTPTRPITPGSGVNTNSLLSKIVSLTKTDTITQSFFYDSSKKVVKVNNVGISNGDKKDDTYFFIRDSIGKVTKAFKIVYAAISLNASKYDTTIATIHYPFGSFKFDYSINTLTTGRSTYRDSIYYSYNAEKIMSVTSYSFDFVLKSYQYSSTKNYTYDVYNNLTTIKIITNSSNPSSRGINGDYKFEYDSKNSPLILGNEALITLGETYFSLNNISKSTLNMTSPQVATIILVLSYNYNANSYPTNASGTATYQGLNSDSQSITYFYK